MAHQRTIDAFNDPPDSEARLLLYTSKPNFTKEQIQKIEELAQQIGDWDFIVETAANKFSAAYLYRALSSCMAGTVPADVLKRLRGSADFTRIRALKVAATQLEFHKSCILPTSVRHAYIKGLALSVQFKGDFVDRFCRDIDVLVEEDQFEEVVLSATEIGYQALLSTNPLKPAESQNDVKFLTKYQGDVGLLSPDGILIEVHRRLDKKNDIFDVETALNTVETVSLSGVEIQTLQKALHFTYVCYHHSRHFWSHLHWLADLDLMIRSPDLNHHQADEIANSVGLAPTIDASRELLNIVSRPELWGPSDRKVGLASEFLNSCLVNLTGGIEVEYELIKHSFTRDFILESQISPDNLDKIAKTTWLRNFHPSLTQYLKRPVHPAFFWLYRVERALILLRDTITQFKVGGTNAKTNSQRSRSLHDHRHDAQ